MKLFFFLLMLAILWVWGHRLYLVIVSKRRESFLTPQSYPPIGPDAPLVSILIPARNEEHNIGNCLASLSKLDYPHFEVLVIDDRSTDKTAAIIEEFSSRDPHIRLIRNTELHEGWTGKNFALFKGQSQAKGQWLLFSDADTTHAPQSLSQSVQFAQDLDLPMITLLPHLVGETFWEKLLQPIAGAILMISFPPTKANDPKSPVAFANGQYILIQRKLYDRIGTHEGLKGYFLEDIAMAKVAKSLGVPVRVVVTPSLYATRMYKTLAEIWHGWSRIYYYIFEKQLLRLVLSIVGIVVVSLLPVFALFGPIGWWLVTGELSYYALMILAMAVIQFLISRFVTFQYYALTGSNPYYSLLNPLGLLIVMGILGDSIVKIYSKKGMSWRGTTYAMK
jgi:cellulose synthase/poly-beta-1,6-N-acetylglucosamine synthase-like glycosyltransferase